MTRTLSLCICLLLAPVAAAAQESGPWEVEVHAGGALASNAGGTGDLPGPGATFTTITGQPSRRVPSWYFGDGAGIMNSVLAAFGRAERLAPIDALLTGGLAERGNGRTLGFRVGRAVTPRVGVEFSLDVTAAPVALSESTVAAVTATNDSFVPAFDSLLRNAPISDGVGRSEYTIEDGAGRQVTATGAVNLNLATRGRVMPYVTIGGGVIANQGEAAQLSLDGSYSFRLEGGSLIDERDRVVVRHVADDRTIVGVFGGGVRTLLTERAGLRIDVRVHVGKDSSRTLLDASPTHVPSAALAEALAANVSPSLQISNNDALAPTTLSGPALAGVETFAADGLFRQVAVTVGYFWRF